jgi:predicted Ser/Thr protein kinase
MREGMELLDLLCYPSGSLECVHSRWKILRDLGVKKLLSYGKVSLGRYRVLGKGHSSIVLAAELDDGLKVAVKVLRSDPKREDISLECRFMRRAYPIAPKVYACFNTLIVMELLEGWHLGEFLNKISECKEFILLVAKISEAVNWLDRIGINHKELVNPLKHVFILHDGRVKIIDYETASSGFGCSLCRFLSWVLHQSRMAGCLRLSPSSKNVITDMLRDYKKGRLDVFQSIIKALMSLT